MGGVEEAEPDLPKPALASFGSCCRWASNLRTFGGISWLSGLCLGERIVAELHRRLPDTGCPALSGARGNQAPALAPPPGSFPGLSPKLRRPLPCGLKVPEQTAHAQSGAFVPTHRARLPPSDPCPCPLPCAWEGVCRWRALRVGREDGSQVGPEAGWGRRPLSSPWRGGQGTAKWQTEERVR